MKNLLLLLNFFSVFIFSQEYHFDYFIQEKSVRVKPDKAEWITNFFYDSKSGNSLIINTQKDKIVATVYDKTKDLRHVFNVKKDVNKLNFSYKHSNRFNNKGNLKNYNKNNVIKVTKLDSLQFKVDIFNNAKLKRKKISAVITLEKAAFDIVKFSADYTRSEEVDEKLKTLLSSDDCYIIKNERITYHGSKYVFEKSTENIQKTDLFLKLPDQLDFKEYNYWSDFEE